MMVTSKRAGEAVLVMAAMADSMMAAVVWEEAGWGRFEGGDMVAMMLVIAVVGSEGRLIMSMVVGMAAD